MNYFPYTSKQVEGVVVSKGYKFFKDKRGYDLNIIGIRTEDPASNTFNDWLCVAYDFDDVMNFFSFPCTTDPGLYYRENPAHVDGTGIMVPGQYSSLWTIGKHQGKYEALVQRNPVKVYRDNDKDIILESGAIKEGLFGINLHRANASKSSIQVDKWSAGCQVIQNPHHFDFIMQLCKLQVSTLGYNNFTYTLLEEKDFR